MVRITDRRFSSIFIGIAIALILFVWMIGFVHANDGRARMDPSVRLLIDMPSQMRPAFAGKFKVRTAPQSEELSVIIDYSGDTSDLLALGARVRSKLGNLITADIPFDQIDAVAALTDTDFIQSSRMLDLQTDVSVPEMGVAGLRDGIPPQWTGYTGKGVIVGVIDTGLDLNHPDFRDANGTRVLYLWDQTTSGASAPPPYNYGTEWTRAQIDSGICTQRDTSGHGTTVTGIAAGNGSATGNGWPAYRYVGVAPEADIIVVKSTFYSDAVVDGIHYIKSRAESLGKPFVINLSIGSQYGAHDGTDLIERAIDQISGPGAVVCTASGNNGTTNTSRFIHAEWVTPTANSTVTAGIEVLSNRSNPFYLDLWYKGNDSIDITITTPNGHSVTKATGSTTNGYVSTPDGSIWLQNSPGGTNPYNGDRECFIAVQDALPGNWSLTARGRTIRGGGACDAWILSGQNVYWSSHGTNTQSCSIPGTSRVVITAGGYTTKTWWTNPDGTLQGWSGVLGSYYTTSGEGPTRDGRLKPDIAAPSTRIAAARSSNAGVSSTDLVEDGVHRVMSGTSSAVPHVTGVVALILQKDTFATAEEIKNYITSTARTDQHTGSVPNTKWGYGKPDVPAALMLAPKTVRVSDAWNQPIGANVRVMGGVITATRSQLGDRLYIGSEDRSSGVQVRESASVNADEGDRVTVRGVIGRFDGEIIIQDAQVTRTSTGTALRPLFMQNRELGGAGELESAGPAINGLSTIGLLVTVSGRVDSEGPDHFIVGESGGLNGEEYAGIKVYCPGLSKPPVGSYVIITGISSTEMEGSIYRPVLRLRRQADLTYH